MGFINILEQDLPKSTEEVKRKSNTPSVRKGLSSAQAQEQLKKYGKNELSHKKSISPMKIFLNQYKDILTVILLVSTVISIVLGDFVEAIAIAIIVLLNGVMGFLQEYKTEKTLEALKKMSAPTAKVYRNGVIKTLCAEMLVVGDVIVLKAGDKIPADCVILEGIALSADEAILTGESLAVSKQSGDCNNLQNELHRTDMLYMGTIVAAGHGEGKIIATGMNTQMGAIAGMLHTMEEEPTQLQKKLAQLGKYIAIGCLIICAIVSVTGVLRGEDVMDMFLMGISLAVSAVPEGLPAIVTIALALAVSRMVKVNALVRRLHAVETLGCTNVICSDKTGTLTQNSMTVTTVFSLDKEIKTDLGYKATSKSSEYLVLLCGVLCNNAKLEAGEKSYGEPTEQALLRLGENSITGLDKAVRDYTRLDEIPFDSKRKCMSVLVSDFTGNRLLFTKGALDFLLPKCTHVMVAGSTKPLTTEYRRRIIAANERMAGSALRVIAMAYKTVIASGAGTANDVVVEKELVFLGLIGMLDPPRPEAIKSVETCKKAGIKTIMITGDHKLTACSIAKQIGIYHAGDTVLEGKDLEHISTQRLAEQVKNTTVFARVSPKHKLLIVEALKKNGNVVAMTGDGVNDAPAIKKADIGVSMGSGTDVTKEASDIVLLDDNFATLVGAVREGRAIYANIRKFIRYLISCNIGEVITMFVGMLMGMPIVLLLIQILLINLVTDGLPAIALGLEPPDDNIMNEKPRGKNEGVFANGLLMKIVFRGIFIGLSTLATFVTALRMTGDLQTARTCAYFTLVVTQLINVFECKSENGGLFSIKPFNNKALLFAVITSFTILLLTIYFSPLQMVLNTVSLSGRNILVSCSFCLIPTITSQILVKRTHGKR